MNPLDLTSADKKHKRKGENPQKVNNIKEINIQSSPKDVPDQVESQKESSEEPKDLEAKDSDSERVSTCFEENNQQNFSKPISNQIKYEDLFPRSRVFPNKQLLENMFHKNEIFPKLCELYERSKSHDSSQSIMTSWEDVDDVISTESFKQTDKFETMTSFNYVNTQLPSNYGDDVKANDVPGIPERTKKQNRWSFNVWREWAKNRNIKNGTFYGPQSVPMDVGRASEIELNYWFCKFVWEIRRKDGQAYPAHTLMQIVMGIQRYLRQQAGRPKIMILNRNNRVFQDFRRALDERIKNLSEESSAKKSVETRSIDDTREVAIGGFLDSDYPADPELLWLGNYISNSSPLTLTRAVFYHCIVTFNLKSVEDHFQLKVSDFRLVTDVPRPYVEFTPSDWHQQRGHRQRLRVYSNGLDEKSPVTLFHRYIRLLPGNESSFYRVWVNSDNNDSLSSQPLSKLQIKSYLSDFSKTSRSFFSGEELPGSSSTSKITNSPSSRSGKFLTSGGLSSAQTRSDNKYSSLNFSACTRLSSWVNVLERQQLNAFQSSLLPSNKKLREDASPDDQTKKRPLKRSADDDQSPETKYIMLSREEETSSSRPSPLPRVTSLQNQAASDDVGSDVTSVIDEDQMLKIIIPSNVYHVKLVKGKKQRIINLS